MREEIKSERTYTQTEYKYTCSRCGDSCGDSEARGSYQILEAKIVSETTENTELHVDGAKLSIEKKNGRKIRILTKDGSSYPEGMNVEQKVIDCCTKCFDEAVIPALLALGFKVRTEERDW